MARELKKDVAFRKLNDLPLNEIFANKYRMYRNFLTMLIKVTKNNYYKNQIKLNKGDPKTIWNIVNEITGSSNKKTTENTIKDIWINEKLTNVKDEPKKVADHFVTYFSDLGTNLARKIKNSHKDNASIPEQSVFRLQESIFFRPVTHKEVSQYILDLKEKSASGIDNIQATTIKKIRKYIIIPLVHIFYLCLEKGVFPDSLKTAVIKPVYKAGQQSKHDKYRPISL